MRLQDFEEAEQQAKQQRVADAELAATQVNMAYSACPLPSVSPDADPLSHNKAD